MIRRQTQKPIIPLAFPYYFFTVVLIALLGFCDAGYLALSHYRNYRDISYQSFCAISRGLNCDTVSQSPYAIFLGVPVSVWGLLGYAFFLSLLGFAWPKNALHKRVWTLLFLMSFGFTLYSLFLAFVSTYRIHSYCIMCIFSYAVNLLLLYFSWLIRKRFMCEPILSASFLDIQYLFSNLKSISAVLSIFGTLTVLLLLFYPTYWQMSLPSLSGEISTGMTEDGHPWIGAETPELVIVEFSDYQCFQCKKMHFFLRQMIQAYPDKIRLIHRHFPIDHTINPIVNQPFHVGSAKLAIIALFAAEKGKFWEMNDLLFNISRETDAINIPDLAQQVGIPFDDIKFVLKDSSLWNKLKQDIQTGLDYKMTGTPGFVIDDEVYMGQIPANIFLGHGIFKTGKFN
jgi:uncharacterized membrane protein